MTRPSRIPDELGNEFSVRDAAALGVGRPRTRRGDLARPYHGVRSRTEPVATLEKASAYRPRLPDHGFFSHTTAAALWGIPLPAFHDPRLHVSYPHRIRPARTVGVVGHHLVIRPEEITEIHGLPTTTPERTWADLAGHLGFEDLVAAGDRVIWRRDSLASLASVQDLAHRHPGRRGRPQRLAALPWLCDRSDSPPETKLRVRFIRAGLPGPAVNVDVWSPDGEFLGRPDLAFPEYRELVDYEGDGHRTDREQWSRDLARVPRFEAADWHTHRASRVDLGNGSRDLIVRIARVLRAKGWNGELRL